MAGDEVPKKKNSAVLDDPTGKPNKKKKPTDGTPKVKKKKKPAPVASSSSVDDSDANSAAGTPLNTARKKKRVPNSSNKATGGTPKSGATRKKSATSTTSASSSLDDGSNGSGVGRGAGLDPTKKPPSARAGLSSPPAASKPPPMTRSSRNLAQGDTGTPRQSLSKSPGSTDDSNSGKPPSLRAAMSSRFVSSPAKQPAKQPSMARPGLMSINEDKSAKMNNNSNLEGGKTRPQSPSNANNNNNNNNNTNNNGGGNAGPRKPMSMGSMRFGGPKPLHHSDHNAGRGGRGRGRGGRGSGPGPRANSMMHLDNRPPPRQPKSADPNLNNNINGTAAPPPAPKRGGVPRRATSDTSDMKRFQDNMGFSQRPGSSRKLPPGSGTRTDMAGNLISGNLHSASAHGTAPQSILRNSSHHRRPKSSASFANRGRQRPNVEEPQRSETPPMVGFGKDDPPRGAHLVGFGSDDIEMVDINFGPKSKSMRKNPSNGMDMSVHSFATQQSVLSIDKGEFEDDPHWKRALRYIRLLPPHHNEKPDKKKARILTWVVLTLDFVAAMVSLTTYDGVQTCCGVQVFSSVASLDWNRAIRIITYVYMIFIFLEIIPVVRNGIPFNLVNPIMGFMITFAMFFDDRVGEAVCMWLIEATAIACEFWVYRIKSNVYHKREARLAKCDKDLEALKAQSKSARNLTRSVSSASFGSFSDSDADSFGGESFHDESAFEDRNNFKLREVRILRERRILRQTQSADRVQLRYHSIGVAIGLGLVAISLILIVFIARAGGLCIKDGKRPVVFGLNQLEECDACQGTTGVCEFCPEEGSIEVQQCYYPYLKTTNK